MSAYRFFTTMTLILGCLLATGCAQSVLAPPPMIAQDKPYKFVIATFHISGNKITFVTSRVDEGWASDRQKMGDFRVILYASNHQTVLEEYRIPDPRRGYGPENPERGISLGPIWGDDIDFDLVFPLYPDLRFIEISVGEQAVTVNLGEQLSQYLKTLNGRH